MCCGSKSRLGGFVSRVRRSPGRRVLMNAAALLVAAVFTAPIAVLALGSLRRPGQPPPDGLELLPERTTTGNYATAVRMGDLAGQLGNSLLIVAVAVPATVLVASWAGFAIATARRRTRRALVRAAMRGGLSAVRRWRLLSPPALPAAFAVAMLAFVTYWSTVIDPLLLLPSQERWPLSLGLWSLSSLDPPMYPIFLAGAVLATLPPVVVFLLAQRAFLTRTLE